MFNSSKAKSNESFNNFDTKLFILDCLSIDFVGISLLNISSGISTDSQFDDRTIPESEFVNFGSLHLEDNFCKG